MATEYGSARIVTNGLILSLDAADKNSYPGSGTSWTDVSRNGNNGTLTNGPTFNSANGGYIVFDGSNDYVSMPSGFANFTSGISLEAWVYATTTAAWSRIIELANGAASDNIALIRNTTNSELTFFIYNTGYYLFTTTGNQYSINQWINFMVTADGSNWVIYKNGSAVNTTTNSILPTNTTRTLNYLALSTNAGGGDAYFQGNISMARVYNRALSASEVLQNYNATKSRFGL